MAKKKCPLYVVHGGREIHRNGKPFITIRREGTMSPTAADSVTHRIAALLNKKCR